MINLVILSQLMFLVLHRAGVKGVIILTPILGINWLFGLLAVNEQMLVFEFLFVILNSLQGLLIFLFHCVGSSEVSDNDNQTNLHYWAHRISAMTSTIFL